MKPPSKLLNNFAEFKVFRKVGSAFNNFKNVIADKYSENPAKILVHTGTLGWILSSLAQVGAIVFNDEISADKKSFLVPQEVADAAVNILSFYLITNTLKNTASRLVSTGKLTTPRIKEAMSKRGLNKKIIGDLKIDLTDSGFDDLATHIKPFKKDMEVGASIIGSTISLNIITPLLRNEYASERQKVALSKRQVMDKNLLQSPRGITIADYQKNAATKFSGSLKI